MNGDYQFLKQSVEKERKSVQSARTALASSLDQLGGHHVRQQEYDDAMDAFTEALREKRSVFWQLSPTEDNSSLSGSGSIFSFGTETEGNKVTYDKAIDEIVSTLRSMGNVHSLRGEQDEAMRYYREVTNLRAQKSSVGGDIFSPSDSKTFVSGLNDDSSSLMTEINEDVKALDDLFRSITFRKKGNSSTEEMHTSERVEPKSLNEVPSPSSKRKKSGTTSGDGNNVVENEPFKRSTSSLCITTNTSPVSGNESSEAMEMYKSLLETYDGDKLNHHKEMLNSLALRADLLVEKRRKTMDSEAQPGTTKTKDHELAIEIYSEVLTLHEERRQLSQTDEEQQVNDKEQQQSASNIASTLICMGSIYYKLGNRVEELRMYQEAKGVYRQAFGENHNFVAGTRKNIGMVLAERGEYEEAMKEFEKAMRVYLAINNGNEMNRDVASAISCMGNVKNRVGELDSALVQYMEALRIYKVIHNDSFIPKEGNALESSGRIDSLRDVTSTLKVVGMVHAKIGDLDTAMGFFQDAMTLLRASGAGSNTPVGQETTASVLTRIASIYLKRGDLDQAMSHYREAYDITVRNRGTTNHHEVASILHYIGGIYHKKADYDEAMTCYQEAIRTYHSTLGPGNPTVAGTLVMVGSIYYKRRNLDSAMMFYREGLRLSRDAYGLHHPDVAPIMKSIGTILTKKGEYQEAYTIFRDVLSIKCTVHGTDHPEVASAYKSLGNVHYKLGDLADAERQYRHALNIYRRIKGENHPDTVSSKTTIEHLRYWMKEREQRQLEQRHAKSTARRGSHGERSC
jgi:tetratricopeptide (TPR) repeat protein